MPTAAAFAFARHHFHQTSDHKRNRPKHVERACGKNIQNIQKKKQAYNKNHKGNNLVVRAFAHPLVHHAAHIPRFTLHHIVINLF